MATLEELMIAKDKPTVLETPVETELLTTMDQLDGKLDRPYTEEVAPRLLVVASKTVEEPTVVEDKPSMLEGPVESTLPTNKDELTGRENGPLGEPLELRLDFVEGDAVPESLDGVVDAICDTKARLDDRDSDGLCDNEPIIDDSIVDAAPDIVAALMMDDDGTGVALDVIAMLPIPELESKLGT